ncbi:hypothetical protein WA026_020319 [Henosepilachna vigintioctopunctata]|uniref:procollagen-proline 3-dioxygenase n=1 Tax=Henosepilachna vigintioctopunctata TaxID=420089 RepID=A0AAW1TZ26_9CUCU
MGFGDGKQFRGNQNYAVFDTEVLLSINIQIRRRGKQNSKLEIVKSGPDLKGANRFVAEGLLWKNQCRSLVDIIKKFSIVGDGYDTGSPHTKMETFEGMSLERAILLTYYGLLKIKYLKMIVQVSEDAKQSITRYFRVEKPLYFTYTHLVCRSALKGISKNRTDLSHEIHADNCNIYPDGICEKQPPSYIWRDYSAIIYLNNDFDGGEFFFSSNTQPESIETIVQPACGRMVGFSSGSENLHGVNAVRKGSRCALALWFTFDEIYREKVRDWVYDFLDEG